VLSLPEDLIGGCV